MEYYSVSVLLANIINYIRAKLFYLFSIYSLTQSINYLSTATSRLLKKMASGKAIHIESQNN